MNGDTSSIHKKISSSACRAEDEFWKLRHDMELNADGMRLIRR